MDKVPVRPDREVQYLLKQPASPAVEEEAAGQLSWFLLWRSERKALLLSDAGHFLIYPHPCRPFVC